MSDCPWCKTSDEVMTVDVNVRRCNRCAMIFSAGPATESTLLKFLKTVPPPLVLAPKMDAPAWKPFWFEGNMFFDWIRSPEDFKRLCDAYYKHSPDDILDDAKEATYGGHRSDAERAAFPKYGFRSECDGEPLRAFFERHNMEIPK